MRPDGIGTELDRSPVARDRLLQITQLEKCDAQMDMRLREFRINLKCGTKRGDRLFELATVFQRGAQIGLRFGEVGLQSNGFTKSGNRLIDLPAPFQGIAKIAMSARVARPERDGSAD